MTECIEWSGARDRCGYGRRMVANQNCLVHRLVAAEHYGAEAIKGKVVMHTCDNPACMNIDHLRIGSQADNVRDMVSKGRGGGFLRRWEGHVKA